MIKDIIRENKSILPNNKEIRILKEHFPSCFDSEGKFDLERFKETLGDNIDIKNDGYELKFLGKNYARLLASVDTTTVIIPDEKHNDKPENKNSQNIYISGDNLDGLKHLLKSYSGKVKCIYIDPPYNTGSDGFVYNDNFNFSSEELSVKLSITEEQAKRILAFTNKGSASHSAWLMFMYPRLLLARDLLTQDGVIFISIDDNEQANLKLICDDVFGAENFINTISIKTKIGGVSGSSEGKSLRGATEYLLIYARNKEKMLLNPVYIKTKLSTKIKNYEEKGKSWKYTSVLTKLEGKTLIKEDKIKKMKYYGYKVVESKSISAFAKENKITEEQVYDQYADKIFQTTNAQSSIRQIVLDTTSNEDYEMIGLEYTPIKGKNVDSEIEILYKGDQRRMMMFLSDAVTRIEGECFYLDKITTLWDDIDYNNLSKEGNLEYPNGKKPIKLIQRILDLVLDKEEINNNLVVDFFSGSASTAHACMLESVLDKTTKCISIQINDNLDEVLKNSSGEKKKEIQNLINILDKSNRPHFLDEVGQERITRAAKQIREEYPKTNADLGFKHYTLTEPSSTTLDKLQHFTPEDGLIVGNTVLNDFGVPTILATWLVRDGYGFCDAEQITFADYKAYYKEKHLYLINKELSDKAIAAISDKYENDNSFNLENIVLFGYSFLWTEIESLKANLSRIKDTERNIKINFDIRY